MAVQALDMNPIRFYNTANTIDWETYFPNDHNMAHRVEYFEGIYPQPFFPCWIIDDEIQMQFWMSSVASVTMTVHLPNGDTADITPTLINPSRWEGIDVFLYKYTPSTKGVYYFTLDNFRSDSFYVASEDKFKKRMIKIDYYNSENDFNTVFFDGSTQVFAPTVYLEGILKGGAPRNDIASFETDRGILSKQRATPIPVNTLMFETHRTLLPQANMIFSCDNITVNGITYQNSDVPEFEETEKEDMFTVTVELVETAYNYYRKIV